MMMNLINNIEENPQTNLIYHANQLKNDLEQHKAIRMQQIEAIKLIQISLDKLTNTQTIQIPTNNNSNSNSNTTTVIVYKEANLHKNLLVSKILNKAKYFYYQSIVQTMRLSLLTKLNYYSSLIQQLNSNNSSTDLNNNDNNKNLNESSIVDEMKLLMQQILHETSQFNLNTAPLNNINNNIGEEINVVETTTINPVIETQLDQNNNHINRNLNNNNEDQIKRIKQLNDVKQSLYSLLDNTTNIESAQSAVKPLGNKRSLDQNNDYMNVVDSNHSSHDKNSDMIRSNKRSKTSASNLKNNKNHNKRHNSHHHVNLVCSNESNILGDDTNVINNHYHSLNHHLNHFNLHQTYIK